MPYVILSEERSVKNQNVFSYFTLLEYRQLKYRSFACTEDIVVKEVIANGLFVVYLAIKHMALTSLNSLTSPFAKVKLKYKTEKQWKMMF